MKIAGIFLTLLLSHLCNGQRAITIPLENTSKPGLLKINMNVGDIFIESHPKSEFILETFLEEVDGNAGAGEHEGMIQLKNNSIDLSITHSGNTVNVLSHANKGIEKIVIKGPVDCDMAVLVRAEGDIYVKNVNGALDLSNKVGGIYLNGIKGSVVGHAMNAPIKVEFAEFSTTKPTSIINLNDDVEVTLPSSSKTSLMFKTTDGSIFSDFNISLKTKLDEIQNKNNVKIERWMVGDINEGGQQLTISTMYGNIYLREKQ